MKGGSYITKLINYITVEPVWMLGIIGLTVRLLIQPVGIYRRVCEDKYGFRDDINCEDTTTWPNDVEKDIQKVSTDWDIYVTISYMIPALFANTVFGAWSDLVGRQISMLISLAGLIVAAFGMVLVFSQTFDVPLYVLLLFSLVTGFTGFIALLSTSCFAYLADITPDKQLQSIRMTIYYALGTLAQAIGSVGVSMLSSSLHLTTQAMISQAVALLAFFYVICCIKHIPPALLKHVEREKPLTVTDKHKNGGPCKFLLNIMKLCRDAVKCYCRKREGHRRSFLLIMALVIFVASTTTSEPIQPYTFRQNNGNNRALGWKLEDLAIWTAVVKLCIMFIGGPIIVVLKKYDVRDTMITLLSLTSLSLKWLVVGVASETWHMYIAAGLGCMAELSTASMLSFMANLVQPDEVGKLYTIVGFAYELSVILSKVVYNSIYKATLDFFPGFMFVFAAFLLFLCDLACVWIHYKAKKENVGHESKVKVYDEKEHKI